MSTYAEIYDIWTDDDLKKAIVIAVLKAAQDVLNEDQGITNHANRMLWANATLADPYLWGAKMSVAVIMNSTIQSGTYDDNDVQFVINSVIDVFANTLQ